MKSEGDSPVEIELKYISEDMEPLELLLSKEELAGFRFRKLPAQSVIDRYYDTPEEDLRRNGLALRVRQMGDRFLATVKSLGTAKGGVHRRGEIEVELPKGSDPVIFRDGPIHERIGFLVGDKSLREVCEITQQRQRRMLSRDKAESMELSVDEVTVSLGGTSRTFYEVESELRSEGCEEDLGLLKECLDKMPLRPAEDSKLERALALMAKNPTNKSKQSTKGQKTFGIAPDDTVQRAFMRILRYYYRRFLKAEKGVRKGKDIEELHRMRVASRRIRAAIFLFQPTLKGTEIKELDRGMRKATQQLGLVRDFDVLLEKLRLYADEQKEEDRRDFAVLEDYWNNRRDKNRKDLIEYLDGAKYRKLRKDHQRYFNGFAKSEPSGDSAVEVPEKRIRHVVPTMVWKAYEEVHRYETAIKDAPNETFHSLRIETKRLRYTLEMFTEILGEAAEELLARVIQLQEHLGTLQDSEVTAILLKDFLDDPGKKWKNQITPSVQKTLKKYRRHLEKIQRHQRWSFDEVWSPVVGEDFRQKLSDILSSL